MSEITGEIREAQFAFVSAVVRQLDPLATDAAIERYLTEIETMAVALDSLESPDLAHIEPFTAEWPAGERA